MAKSSAPKAPGIAGWLARKALSWAGLSATDPRVASVFGLPTFTGRAVSPDSAMQISTVWACVRIISEAIGMFPFSVYERKDDGGAEAMPDHPVSMALGQSPNYEQTAPEFGEAIGLNLCLRGNFRALREQSGTKLVALTPIPWDRIRVKRPRTLDNPTNQLQFEVADGMGFKPVPRELVWDVRGFGGDQYEGLSPIGMMRQACGLALATEEVGARLFGQGARPSFIIESPNFLKTEQRDAVYAKLEQQFAGLDNSQKTFILEGGMKHTAVSMPMDEAQFLETRRFQVAEICRIYRVPLHMVQEMAGSTNNNIEWQGQSIVTYTLMPYITRIEQSANKWLLSPADRARGRFCHYDVNALTRGDLDSRAQYFASMVNTGIFSRNEVRAKENMARVKGLDEHTVQVNLMPIDQLGRPNTVPTKKPTQE